MSTQNFKMATIFQNGCQSWFCQPEAESPSDWGWGEVGEQWKVFWRTVMADANATSFVQL